MSDPRRFSSSQLDMFTRCGQQYAFRYLEGLIVPPRVRMIVGSAVDRSVNANLATKIEGGGLLPESDLKDVARTAFDREWRRRGVELEEDERELGLRLVKGQAVDAAVGLAAHHGGVVAPKLEPKHVQRRFDIEVSGYDVTLVGYIDIDEGKKARDTKVTRGQAKIDDATSSSQLTMYAMAKQVLDGAPPDQLALDFLIDRTRNKRDRAPKAVSLVTTRTADDFQPLLNRIERALLLIEAGTFMPAPPGSWWCSHDWCGYWNICPWVRRGALIGATKVTHEQGEQDE